ncbi:MAG: hypothetical protein V5A51_07910, partial [Bacteroidales bacterium]
MSKSSTITNNIHKQAIYFNKPQRMALHVLANQEYHVWARRTGKSHGLTGPRALQNIYMMPGSYGAIIAPTFKMALTQILPNILQAWKYFGFYENVHYVLNRKPPDKWGWEKPFLEPKNYEHLITVHNGSIIAIISQDRVGTSNSRSLDWIIVDEARYINYDRLKTETIPAISGSIETIKRYRHHPRFKSALYCTDMPRLKKSQWILKFEKEMDKDLINTILQLRKKQAKSTSKDVRAQLQKMINELRGYALYYSEANIFDNIRVVGEKYVREQKRVLPEFDFNTSILNIKPGKVEQGFYPALHRYHYYTANDNKYLQNLDYNFQEAKKIDCRMDADLDKHQRLNIALDYNANINWLIVGQHNQVNMNTLKSFFVKSPKRLRELIKNFCEYYEPFPTKEVNYYYDTTALRGNYAVSDYDFKDVVIEELKKHNWRVFPVNIGKPIAHNLKHLYIDQALKGEKYLLPLFNQENNQQLIFAMEQTDIKIGKNGFEKDKSGEKEPETPEN